MFHCYSVPKLHFRLKMKRFLFVFAIVVINSAPSHSTEVATPITPIECKSEQEDIIAIIKPVPISNGCDCLRNRVPLYRLYNPRTDDHFYTTNFAESNNAANALGYIREGITGYVFPPNADCSCFEKYVTVYRLFKAGRGSDHFYTTSVAEASNAAQSLQYQFEGVAFQCAVDKGDCKDCGKRVPLYRYNRNIDHFYTTNLNEGFSNVLPYGGTYEGILCYIWTN